MKINVPTLYMLSVKQQNLVPRRKPTNEVPIRKDSTEDLFMSTFTDDRQNEKGDSRVSTNGTEYELDFDAIVDHGFGQSA